MRYRALSLDERLKRLAFVSGQNPTHAGVGGAPPQHKLRSRRRSADVNEAGLSRRAA